MQANLERLRMAALHAILWASGVLPDFVFFLRVRGFLASLLLPGRPRDLRLGRDVTFYNPGQISLGRHVYVAKGCWFSADARITVGDEVLFGPYCVITSSRHSLKGVSFRYGKSVPAPVSIGTGSWIAAHAVLSAGAKVGPGTLVAAQSVVTGELPGHVLAAGQPARAVRELEEDAGE